jgi:hypothetical protein
MAVHAYTMQYMHAADPALYDDAPSGDNSTSNQQCERRVNVLIQ